MYIQKEDICSSRRKVESSVTELDFPFLGSCRGAFFDMRSTLKINIYMHLILRNYTDMLKNMQNGWSLRSFPKIPSPHSPSHPKASWGHSVPDPPKLEMYETNNTGELLELTDLTGGRSGRGAYCPAGSASGTVRWTWGDSGVGGGCGQSAASRD